MQKMSKELLEILFTIIGVYISLMCHYDHRIYVRQQNICRNLVSENRFCNNKIKFVFGKFPDKCSRLEECENVTAYLNGTIIWFCENVEKTKKYIIIIKVI